MTIPALEIEREARISNIGTLINPQNRTFKIEADISNRDRKLKPNLQALIKVKQFEQTEAVVIPTNLIMKDGEDSYVYVVEQTPKGKKAKKQIVIVGRNSNGESIIEEGLTGEESLVADGKNLVKDQDLLRIR